ncbi:MAG: hypothetical protein M1812_008213, partial [Candelaria pacifica]
MTVLPGDQQEINRIKIKLHLNGHSHHGKVQDLLPQKGKEKMEKVESSLSNRLKTEEEYLDHMNQKPKTVNRKKVRPLNKEIKDMKRKANIHILQLTGEIQPNR